MSVRFTCASNIIDYFVADASVAALSYLPTFFLICRRFPPLSSNMVVALMQGFLKLVSIPGGNEIEC